MDGPTGTAHRLVGRTAELRRLQSVVVAGEGLRIALVGGEAGIGKTRLVDEAVAAVLPNSLVLRLRGDLDRRNRPFGALLAALEPVVAAWVEVPPPLAPRAAAVRELLAPVAPGLAGSSTDPVAGADQLERAAVDVLRHLTPDPAPLVLVADDLHWVDGESVGVLQQVVAGVAGLDDAVLVGTYRPDALLARSPLSALLATVERRHDGINLRLDRLSIDDVADFAAQALGDDVPYRAVKTLHQRSGGNPFFLEELLAVAATAGVDQIADLPLPWTVTELLRDTVHALSADERRVVEAAAVLGQHVPFDLLARVTALSEEELIDRLRGVVGAGLLVEDDVDVFSFRHALVRESVAEALLGRERRRLHEAALAVLTAADDRDDAAIAHHAAGAGHIDEMIDAVRRASRRSLARGAANQALDFAEMGLAEAPDDLELSEVATRAAWLVGALDDAVAHGERWARCAGDPAEESRARRVLARIAWDAGDDVGQRRACERLRELAEVLPAGEARAALLADLAQASMLSHRPDEAIEYATLAIADADLVGAAAPRTQALVEHWSSMAILGRDLPQVISGMLEAVDEAERLGDHLTAARGLNNIADLVPVGERRSIVERMRDNAETAGFAMLAAFSYAEKLAELASLSADRGQLELWLGDAWRWSRLGPCCRGSAWLRYYDALLVTEASVPDTVVTHPFAAEPGRVVGDDAAGAMAALFVAARAGDADAARDALAGWSDAVAGGSCDGRNAPSVVEAALRAGIPADAVEAVVTATLPADSVHPAHVAAVRAFVALAERRPVADEEIDVATAGDEVEGWLRGELHLRLAENALATDADTADRHLSEAAALLARWPGWRRDRADAMRRRLDGRVGGGDLQLSSRELEVAALLAEGLTNAQLAERLFIARKTAAVHVSNILAKLGMRSRAEIAAWAVRNDLQERTTPRAG